MRSYLLKELIEEKADQFSPGYEKLAHYLVENGDEAVFMSVREIGRRLSISEAMVVRFAQELGFKGFRELQDEMQREFRRVINMVTQMRDTLREMGGEPNLYQRVARMEIEYLKRSTDNISEEGMEKAVNMISQARRVFLFAVGSSQSLADILEFRLQRLGLLVVKIEDAGKYLLDKLALIDQEDALVVSGFIRLSREMEIAIEVAGERGVNTILITDVIRIGKESDHLIKLAARRGPIKMFHSLVVPMAIVDCLIIGTALKMGDRALMSLKQLDSLREKYHYSKIGSPTVWEQEQMDQISRVQSQYQREH